MGKLDATADRKAGVLRVNAIHQDVPLDTTMTAAVDGEDRPGPMARTGPHAAGLNEFGRTLGSARQGRRLRTASAVCPGS